MKGAFHSPHPLFSHLGLAEIKNNIIIKKEKILFKFYCYQTVCIDRLWTPDLISKLRKFTTVQENRQPHFANRGRLIPLKQQVSPIWGASHSPSSSSSQSSGLTLFGSATYSGSSSSQSSGF